MDTKQSIARRAAIYSYAPVKDLVRRGWIEESDDVVILEARVLRFYGTNSLNEEPQPLRHAARKSTSYDYPLTRGQQAWLSRANQIAVTLPVGRLSRSSIDRSISELQQILEHPEELRHVPRILNEAGIRFVVIEGLPGNKIDGAVIWDDEGTPTIALSLRFDRIDNFWFVLFHEIAHVREGERSVDVDLITTVEAQDHLVQQLLLDRFITRVGPLYSLPQIEAFARTQHVHPGIVVGQAPSPQGGAVRAIPSRHRQDPSDPDSDGYH